MIAWGYVIGVVRRVVSCRSLCTQWLSKRLLYNFFFFLWRLKLIQKYRLYIITLVRRLTELYGLTGYEQYYYYIYSYIIVGEAVVIIYGEMLNKEEIHMTLKAMHTYQMPTP